MFNPIENGTVLNIQGLECNIPQEGYVYNVITDKVEQREIYSRSEIKEEQYWERIKPPVWYIEVIRKWDAYDKSKKDEDPDFYDERLEKYKKQEWDRRLNGMWFYNNGTPTYLTGMHYMFLQWWQIDIGFPKFRITDLEYFYFLQYCIEDSQCMGMLEITKRRFGKTFRGGLFLYEYITRTKRTNAGIQSKTGSDAKKLYNKAVINPFILLPKFFRPEYDMGGGMRPKTALVFQQTNVKGRKAESGLGKEELGSMIDHEDAELYAYDGQKIHRYFSDEWAKTVSVNIYDRHEVIRYCLMDDEGNIIGKALYSSTVEKAEKADDKDDITKAAKKLWDESDHTKRMDNGRTPSGLYRFFMTADRARYFDVYGYPNVEKTVKEILADRDSVKNNPRALAARTRKEARTIEEAWMESGDKCIFNIVNIVKRLKDLVEYPIVKRSIWFYRDEDTQLVKWRDITPKEKDFHWKVTPDFPLSNEGSNKFKLDGRFRKPNNVEFGAIGIDGYSNTQGGKKWGSKASAFIGQRMRDGRRKKVIGHIYGRPIEKDILHNQVMLAAEFLGVIAYYEHNSDDYYTYFKQRGRLHYLGLYPKILIDPIKLEKTERHRGVPTHEYSLTKQSDLGVSYFENNIDDIDFEEVLEDAKTFDPNDRTKSDITVSFLITNAVLSEAPVKPPPNKTPLVNVYGRDGKLVTN